DVPVDVRAGIRRQQPVDDGVRRQRQKRDGGVRRAGDEVGNGKVAVQGGDACDLQCGADVREPVDARVAYEMRQYAHDQRTGDVRPSIDNRVCGDTPQAYRRVARANEQIGDRDVSGDLQRRTNVHVAVALGVGGKRLDARETLRGGRDIALHCGVRDDAADMQRAIAGDVRGERDARVRHQECNRIDALRDEVRLPRDFNRAVGV